MRLLSGAAKRLRADRALTELSLNQAAFAAVMCGKEGQKAVEKLRAILQKQTEPEK